MTYLVQLADRAIGRPLLLAPEKAEVILGVLAARLGVDAIESDRPAPELNRFAGKQSDRQPYRVTKEGIALIPIIGTLVNRGAYIGASSGLTSYEGLTEQLSKAQKDPEIRGILLDIDSPGGEAGGAFELPAQIREIRKTKPVHAVVNSMALSGGYLIASAAERISLVSTGLVGSIGVVMVHMDRSGELEKAGRVATIIHSGQRKADGNSLGPLPRDVKARIQGELDQMREMFVASVVAGRPKLKPEAVRATEAGIYMGEDAIAAGLADEIATFDRVVESMTKSLSRHITPPAGYTPKLERPMSQDTTAPAQAGPDQAALDRARADGTAAGIEKGRNDERTRIAGILGSDEAKGRADLAAHLAFKTEMTVDTARGLLGKAPVQTAASVEAKPAQNASTIAVYERAIAASGANPQVPHVDAGGATTRQSTLKSRMSERFAAAHK